MSSLAVTATRFWSSLGKGGAGSFWVPHGWGKGWPRAEPHAAGGGFLQRCSGGPGMASTSPATPEGAPGHTVTGSPVASPSWRCRHGCRWPCFPLRVV